MSGCLRRETGGVKRDLLVRGTEIEVKGRGVRKGRELEVFKKEKMMRGKVIEVE